ncbi:hypothetical protein [Bradyrhizobium septentrionale]|uniref:Uncharacterized protein n=1 Tax=Bradyrhizobium septentrionale TaxID=1404411 RepID=A0ABZ2NPF8_9BRAD
MKNEPDLTQLAIGVAVAVAEAPFVELEHQSAALRELVDDCLIEKQRAVDILYTAALACGLVHRHGDDAVQEMITFGFEGAA